MNDTPTDDRSLGDEIGAPEKLQAEPDVPRPGGTAPTIAPVDLTQRLRGRVAVITGGASGIGLATARRLRAEGAQVVIGDLDRTAGERAAAEVEGLFVPVDVTDQEQVDHLFDEAARVYGSVDIAFNNAGISPPDDDSIETTEPPAWKTVQDVNLTSVYLCSRAALRHMTRQGRGSIINTASFVAVMGSATSQISYTASKGGVLAMSRELGVQFARQGIRVNALCPGPVATPCRRSCTPTTRSVPSVGWCTCPWDASAVRRSWPRPWPSWPATTPRSSRPRRSWSTAGSARRTSPRCDPHGPPEAEGGQGGEDVRS